MRHSLFYSKNVSEYPSRDKNDRVFKEYRINATALSEAIMAVPTNDLQTVYSQMSDLLRETNDAQFGIVSSLVEVQDSNPVEYEWVRDATRSLPLAERMSHNAPVIEANNALLRCLSRVRPVDYAINNKYGAHKPGPACRELLQVHFDLCTRSILTVAQSNKSDSEKLKQIEKIENRFNSSVVKVLHEANLTQGCYSKEDAEHLLFHYRNLSSLLDNPSRAMVTLTYDESAGIFQRETQYPVTEKTPKQHNIIKELAKIQIHPFDVEKNAHNSKSSAIQEADSLFVALMDEDTTTLSAQARKTHLVGAKNAFIVKNELIPLDELPDTDLSQIHAEKENTLWLARSGVPVYVGSGENSMRVNEHTSENLEQIRMAAAKRTGMPSPKLHITCLNTYSPLENQIKMIDSLYKATRDIGHGDEISYVPTNLEGTFRVMDVAPHLQFAAGKRPSGLFPLQRKDRLEQASKIVLAAADTESTISIVQCASGQDRTGTTVEKATQSWMHKRYLALGKDPACIDAMRASGGNAAEITTHHIHGSPGMKTESMGNNFFGNTTAFSDAASEQFYRKSANSNKKNKVDSIDFLNRPSKETKKVYEQNLNAFEESLNNFEGTISGNPKKQQFYISALDLLSRIKNIGLIDNPNAQSFDELNAILPHCIYLTNNHDKTNSPEFRESTRRLASLSHHVSGSSSPVWQALGASLITFACAALIVAGVLAAIPSGGTSLLLAVAGATGLSLGTAAALGAGVVAASAVSGGVALKVGSEKGLARSITLFKSSLNEMKQEGDEPPNFRKVVASELN
ncbi:hypothetical protein [uncultured Legionella sp.]|uniref:hypothetical protein n=1 Tax=uncultured Legionella sp. TaxID=210934 RepID=UPI0026284E8C|nr:hypothetical protein [uncultured Legionella sp.]